MKSTQPSPSPIHKYWDLSCECRDCLSRRFQESTPYWTSTKYTYVEEAVSEHSTNSTVSNLPGPGRTLDHFLGILGRKFHAFSGEIAHDLGFGPSATTARVESQIVKLDAKSHSDKQEKEWKKITKDCAKLLKYMERYANSSADLHDDDPLILEFEFISTHTDNTRHQAMRGLYELASRDIRVRDIFVKIGADPFLHFLHNILMRENSANHDHLMLLSACRRAMVCTEENTIHSLAKNLVYMLDPMQSMDRIIYAEACIQWQHLCSVAEGR